MRSTVFSKLNNCPEGLSTDRLKRVKSKVSSNQNKKGKVINKNEVGLFDDVALHLKESSSSSSYTVGRILRMRNQSKSITEFKRSVSLDKADPNLYVLVNLYVKEENQDLYSYNNEPATSHKEFAFKTIITKVSLDLNDNGKFTLDKNDTKSSQ